MLYGKWNKELSGEMGNFEKGFEAATGFKNRIEDPRSPPTADGESPYAR
ncbi:MAG: hypothetical protein PHR03_03115 [Desulfovibrionales bacterium]|nr:hypothetical protein [Desulfovibrionales bacterium]